MKDLEKLKKMLGRGIPPKEPVLTPEDEANIPKGTLYDLGFRWGQFGATIEQAKGLFDTQERANVPKYKSRPLKTKTTENREEDFWNGYRAGKETVNGKKA